MAEGTGDSHAVPGPLPLPLLALPLLPDEQRVGPPLLLQGGLDGEEGPEEAGPEEAGPNSTRRLDLPRGGGGGRGYGALHLEKIS